MSLRRLAQTNNARPHSPRTPGAGQDSPLQSPIRPSRPRASVNIHQSPANLPSVSSSIPFDWDAARGLKPAPYGTPRRLDRGRHSMAVDATSTPGESPARRERKSQIRKRTFKERFTDLPNKIAFEISMFPSNVPLPEPRTSGRILGGLLHFVHFCVKVSQSQSTSDSNVAWEDMHREANGVSWFDWSVPLKFTLLGLSLLNAFYLFTRTRLYRLHRRQDPINSPNSRFVSSELDYDPLEVPSLTARLSVGFWQLFVSFWRFLLGLKPPVPPANIRKATKVQQLEVWIPGDTELTLFSVYSPVHFLLWTATNIDNWMMLVVVMGATSLQLHALIQTYAMMVKDKEIIAGEVMNEYNEGFVYPRVNPIRRDASTMTHQSEVVNVWED